MINFYKSPGGTEAIKKIVFLQTLKVNGNNKTRKIGEIKIRNGVAAIPIGLKEKLAADNFNWDQHFGIRKRGEFYVKTPAAED